MEKARIVKIQKKDEKLFIPEPFTDKCWILTDLVQIKNVDLVTSMIEICKNYPRLEILDLSGFIITSIGELMEIWKTLKTCTELKFLLLFSNSLPIDKYCHKFESSQLTKLVWILDHQLNYSCFGGSQEDHNRLFPIIQATHREFFGEYFDDITRLKSYQTLSLKIVDVIPIKSLLEIKSVIGPDIILWFVNNELFHVRKCYGETWKSIVSSGDILLRLFLFHQKSDISIVLGYAGPQIGNLMEAHFTNKLNAKDIFNTVQKTTVSGLVVDVRCKDPDDEEQMKYCKILEGEYNGKK